MSQHRWVEVNIHLRDPSLTDQVLLGFVRSFVQQMKEKHSLESWHYLLEPEIRLRFCASESSAKAIRNELEQRLTALEGEASDVYSKHVFRDDYHGETEYYKEKGWPIVMRYLEHGSEMALIFLENEPRGQPEKPWGFYIVRIMHVLLNQISFPEKIAPLPNGGFFVGMPVSEEIARECYPGNFQ